MIYILDYKIFLINIPVSTDYSAYSTNLTHQEHLGLAYLASILKKNNFNVKIIDANIQKYHLKQLITLMEEKKPDFIGLTATSYSIENAIKFSKEFDAYNCHLCIGGHHATFAAKEILKESNFDSVVYGEGEITVIELLDALKIGKELNNIRGLYYKQGEEIITNPTRENIESLDSLPFPDRTIPKYCLRNNKRIIINIISSRGCPYNCSFCDIAKFYRLGGSPWRARSPKNFVDELELITEEFPNFFVQFSDDNFIGYTEKKSRIYNIANEILDRGIKVKFDIRCRADSFDINKDDDLIKLLKTAGLNSILMGIDGGCDSVLQVYRKGINRDQNLKMIEYLRKFDVVLQMGYIMFNPYLTLSTLKKQLEFFLESKQTLYSQMTNRLEIYPGIDLINKLKEDDLLLDCNHRKLYPYSYREDRVKILAENLSSIQPEMDSFDGLIQHLELLRPEMDNLKGISDLKKLINEIYEKKEQITKLYYKLFQSAIDLVEKDWDAIKFNKLKREILDKLHQIHASISSLILQVNNYLR